MIYLDSAATSLQKPKAVARAVGEAVRGLASPGRGGYPAAMKAANLAFRCREEAAELFGLTGPEQVIFTGSATHGLNLAIHSLAEPGSRILISGWEHNAVWRCVNSIPEVQVRIASGPLFDREALLGAFDRELREETDLCVCTHVSNVFGYILPLEEIAALCRKRGVPLIVDASQSAGVLPVRPEAWGAAFAALPGHKGLYGPQGIGLLLCGRGQVGTPLLYGGTGSASAGAEMPDFLPDRLEAGTHNMPGIAGLLEGIRFVRSHGTERILMRERSLLRRLIRGMKTIPGCQVFAAEDPALQSGVLSFHIKWEDCEETARRLAIRGIAVRAGLHCAPLAHKSGGTLDSGTVRISLSAFNTEQEIGQLLRVLSELQKK